MAVIFWRVVFPFHAQACSTIKMKSIHIICVIVGLLFPLIPVIAAMADFGIEVNEQPENTPFPLKFLSGGWGFRQIRFPPILCSGRNLEVEFYSFVLIGDIILAIGCLLVLIIIWSVYKVQNEMKATKVCQSVTA